MGRILTGSRLLTLIFLTLNFLTRKNRKKSNFAKKNVLKIQKILNKKIKEFGQKIQQISVKNKKNLC